MKPIGNLDTLKAFVASAARHVGKAGYSVRSRFLDGLAEAALTRQDSLVDSGDTLTFKASERFSLEAEMAARNVGEFGNFPRLSKGRTSFDIAVEAALRPVVVGTSKSEFRWRWIRLADDIEAAQAALPDPLRSVADYVEPGEASLPTHVAYLVLENRDGAPVGAALINYTQVHDSSFEAGAVPQDRFEKALEAARAFVGPRLVLDCYPSAAFDAGEYVSNEGFTIRLDDAGFLHSDVGPAFVTPDGEAEWWTHGVARTDPRPENMRGEPYDPDAEDEVDDDDNFDPNYDDGANAYGP
jgi:hypothetical protein